MVARGARVRMVTTELRGEKVDIVPFSDDPAELVSRALQPAKVEEVILDEERGRATVIVHDYQLSLAIGQGRPECAPRGGALTGWHIDIKSESEAAEETHYAEGEWAEGEWVEQSGEMVWKPAEGGETMSAEAWAVGEKAEPRRRPANPITPRSRSPPTSCRRRRADARGCHGG